GLLTDPVLEGLGRGEDLQIVHLGAVDRGGHRPVLGELASAGTLAVVDGELRYLAALAPRPRLVLPAGVGSGEPMAEREASCERGYHEQRAGDQPTATRALAGNGRITGHARRRVVRTTGVQRGVARRDGLTGRGLRHPQHGPGLVR